MSAFLCFYCASHMHGLTLLIGQRCVGVLVKMNFDSPDVAKDFPGLYGEEHCKCC